MNVVMKSPGFTELALVGEEQPAAARRRSSARACRSSSSTKIRGSTRPRSASSGSRSSGGPPVRVGTKRGGAEGQSFSMTGLHGGSGTRGCTAHCREAGAIQPEGPWSFRSGALAFRSGEKEGAGASPVDTPAPENTSTRPAVRRHLGPPTRASSSGLLARSPHPRTGSRTVSRLGPPGPSARPLQPPAGCLPGLEASSRTGQHTFQIQCSARWASSSLA